MPDLKTANPKFSFLLPTRERVPQLRRFLQSAFDLAADPEALEVVLGIDEDDLATQAFEDKRFNIKKVLFSKGMAMGAMNQACFEKSSGRYVMISNDDVIVRTKDWDRMVYAAMATFGDDIGMIHVNDLLFRERLCTFPILSRRACLEIGACPTYYFRYRNDDHIGDVYHLLAHLGYGRILYLPDVVFEHLNYAQQQDPKGDHDFKSKDGKTYTPNPEIIAKDAAVYDAKLGERKGAALRLARIIEGNRQVAVETRHKSVLASVRDSYSYRKKEYVRQWPPDVQKSGRRPTVTIGIVSADLQSGYARKCLDLVKRHTLHYDLVVLDNNRGADFNHPREMNKILGIAKTDYVVLMDDDVFVRQGWLEAILEAFDGETGVVTPAYKDGRGRISYSGIYMLGDGLGTHWHHMDLPPKPRPAQTICSAVTAIDMNKCGHFRFNESYSKYFHDIEFGLKIWEGGFRVLCAPRVPVVHLGGATMPYGSQRSQKLWNQDLRIFIDEWVKTGRLARIEANVWNRDPFLAKTVEIPKRIWALKELAERGDVLDFELEINRLLAETRRIRSGFVRWFKPYDLFRFALAGVLQKARQSCEARGDVVKADICTKALGQLKRYPRITPGFAPMLVGGLGNYNIVEYGDKLYAAPIFFGQVDFSDKHIQSTPGIICGDTRAELENAISQRMPVSDNCGAGFDLIEEGYKRFNILSWNGQYYAFHQDEGTFQPEMVRNHAYSHCYAGISVSEVKKMVDVAVRNRPDLLARHVSIRSRVKKWLGPRGVIAVRKAKVAIRRSLGKE